MEKESKFIERINRSLPMLNGIALIIVLLLGVTIIGVLLYLAFTL